MEMKTESKSVLGDWVLRAITLSVFGFDGGHRAEGDDSCFRN